jgi:hypothetical protein
MKSSLFNYPPRDFSNIIAKVKLMLEKNTSFMLLKFEVVVLLIYPVTVAATRFNSNYGKILKYW